VRKFTLAVWIFGIAAISILGTGQAYAQVAGATLTGTVKDSSTGIIPNAQVAITDVATAVTRTVSSGGAGLYTAPNLLPWTYEVRVTAAGFNAQLPGVSNLDFSLIKNTYVKRISETFDAQFRAEVLNILNRANFALPPAPTDTGIFDPSGAKNDAAGRVKSTTTTGREIQFALKFTW
jgi:hypothetical protein